MSDPLSSVTLDLALASLDLSMVRHRLIAANVANHATPGYEPQRLNFESLLAEVNASIEAGSSRELVRDRLDSLLQAPPVEAEAGQSVQLDDEMGKLIANTLHYEAVLTSLTKLGALNRLAINGALS